VPHWTPALVTATAVGAVAAFILVGLVPTQTPDTWWFLILSGAVAICAMILPGISGAFILVLLGKYQFVLNAVNQRDFLTLIFVAIGAAIGLISFAQILGWLFKQYHDMTVAVLIGLMIGSLRKIWPWKIDVAWLQDTGGALVLDSHGERIVTQQNLTLPDFATGAGIMEFVIAVIVALIGLGLILWLDRVANRKV
jgi:putative membrane protein